MKAGTDDAKVTNRTLRLGHQDVFAHFDVSPEDALMIHQEHAYASPIGYKPLCWCRWRDRNLQIVISVTEEFLK